MDCNQAEKVLATFGGHLVIMLCSSERRESVLGVLYQLVLSGTCPKILYQSFLPIIPYSNDLSSVFQLRNNLHVPSKIMKW